MSLWLGCWLLCAGMVVSVQAQAPSGLIIQEIMADPVPVQQLPPIEYVEIRNLSGTSVLLQGMSLSDGSSKAVIQAALVLQPDSCLLLCGTTSVALLQPYGRVVGLSSFPSLNNEGDSLILRNAQGRVLHAVAYASSWYRNAFQSDGGWSLEMVDPRQACLGASNWRASPSAAGGTPGKNPDSSAVTVTAPALRCVQAVVVNPYQVNLVFSESLDSSAAVEGSRYTWGQPLSAPDKIECPGPWFQEVRINWRQPVFFAQQVFQVRMPVMKLCTGTEVGALPAMNLGLAVRPDRTDIRINEVLFEPVSGGAPFIELYHQGKSALDLSKLMLANRTVGGQLQNLRTLSEERRFAYPRQYLLVTDDTALLGSRYPLGDSAVIIERTLPSLPDDAGKIVVLYADGTVLDELHYETRWHHPLLSSTKGVSLERVRIEGATQDKHNWHSGSTHTGYATPGERNAQSFQVQGPDPDPFSVPNWFSPNYDGVDDLLLIQYAFTEPGMICHAAVYHTGGALMRVIEDHALCGQKGFFQWDGTREDGSMVPTGYYVLWLETYNGEGQVKKFKKAIAVIAERE
jgi:hypothetical protein